MESPIIVELKHYTPLEICSNAIRTCWNSFSKSTPESDRKLINDVGNIKKHKSVLEHLFYNFNIKGISRLCLQELARHRIASFSVKSTRYTLNELKNADIDRDYKKYIRLVNNDEINKHNIETLKHIQKLLLDGINKDTIKYILPESYLTELYFSINARSLQNFLELRSSKYAHFEMQELSQKIFFALPKEHHYIFERRFLNDEYFERIERNYSLCNQRDGGDKFI